MTDWITLHACPHRCGAQLGIRSKTPEGDKAKCGKCGQPTIWRKGKLRKGKA